MKTQSQPNPTANTNLSAASLCEIAEQIRQDWRPVKYSAAPYLDAMSSLDSINDNYGADTGRSVVAYFLGNATSWRGETARQVKAELNKRLKAK